MIVILKRSLLAKYLIPTYDKEHGRRYVYLYLKDTHTTTMLLKNDLFIYFLC